MVVGAETTAPPAPRMPGDVGAAVAEADAPDAPMRVTSACRSATPRGRGLTPTAVGMGGSPPAKRPTARTAADVPPAPSRKMTMQEVAHSLQHLMAQATRHDVDLRDADRPRGPRQAD